MADGSCSRASISAPAVSMRGSVATSLPSTPVRSPAQPLRADARADRDGGSGVVPATDRPPVFSLTAREQEVLALLAEGMTNAQLAEVLFISERTANRHVSNIFTKLGVHNRTQAARAAVAAGLAG